ncbi:drug resistance transporter YcnB [Piromyces finnis]|uniref:Drug resistance transporter YcnB n=1 Tax=Piromyces finnis TaxID=1754191 RepID=A0A1Y1V1C6_9FUNG|nr:drug resistance transporter YcnB [Piromyces finnis]|eukprot:ORX45034.1 drug resistance transporter YcnB [Piromyces finnis]
MLATSLTTALPPIMKDLNITVNTGQWLTSGFILCLAVMTPFTAYLITRFRTKPLYFIAVGFFIGGLIICSLSKSFYLMLAGRIIQGAGNGLLSSIGQVIILTIFPKEKIGAMMGWYGLSFGVAPIIAPTVAGVLVDSIGWRTIFYIAIGIMIISLIWAICIFDDVLPVMRKQFDFISFFLSILTFGGVTLAISNVGTNDFVSYEVLVPLIIGILAGLVFFPRQLKVKVPFLDIRVMKDKNYLISSIATVVLQFTIMGSAIVVPVYVQQIKGESATTSGLVLLPGSLALAVMSPLAGRIYDKIGIKPLIIIGPVLLCVSNLVVYFINVHQSVWIYSLINIARCISIGILLMPLVTWSMIDIPKTKTSDATALYNSLRAVSGAIGSACYISIMTKVANAVRHKKESPEMYGVNVVFLVMAALSFIVFLIGIFACQQTKSPSKAKKAIEKKIEDPIEKKINDDKESVEIDITDISEKKKDLDKKSINESEISTVIEASSVNEAASTDVETIQGGDNVDNNKNSEIKVVINDGKN